ISFSSMCRQARADQTFVLSVGRRRRLRPTGKRASFRVVSLYPFAAGGNQVRILQRRRKRLGNEVAESIVDLQLLREGQSVRAARPDAVVAGLHREMRRRRIYLRKIRYPFIQSVTGA